VFTGICFAVALSMRPPTATPDGAVA